MTKYNDLIQLTNHIKQKHNHKYTYPTTQVEPFPTVQVGNIGKSVQGRNIEYIQIGSGQKNIIIQSAIHAREYATMDIALLWICDCLLQLDKQYFANFDNTAINSYIHYLQSIDNTTQHNHKDQVNNTSTTNKPSNQSTHPNNINVKPTSINQSNAPINSQHNAISPIKSLCNSIDSNDNQPNSVNTTNLASVLQKYCFYVFPCTNPDGVHMAQQGGQYLLYKANANGVDLNTNFDARWGTGIQNKRVVDASDYIGNNPHDQPETQALVHFTQTIKPISTLSIHARGREVYPDFFAPPNDTQRDYKIAQYIVNKINQTSQQSIQNKSNNQKNFDNQSALYKVVSSQSTSSGGYKDWCIQHLHIPAFTIETFEENEQFPINQSTILQEYKIIRLLPLYWLQALDQYDNQAIPNFLHNNNKK